MRSIVLGRRSEVSVHPGRETNSNAYRPVIRTVRPDCLSRLVVVSEGPGQDGLDRVPSHPPAAPRTSRSFLLLPPRSLPYLPPGRSSSTWTLRTGRRRRQPLSPASAPELGAADPSDLALRSGAVPSLWSEDEGRRRHHLARTGRPPGEDPAPFHSSWRDRCLPCPAPFRYRRVARSASLRSPRGPAGGAEAVKRSGA